MPTYVLLVTFTEKGKRNFKQEYTVTRETFVKAAKEAGGSLTGYVTAGPYDAVEILDVPNDDIALDMLLGSLSVDAVKIMTLRGFPADQVKQALRKQP
jgi:uncharacterized protein with GYD domain